MNCSIGLFGTAENPAYDQIVTCGRLSLRIRGGELRRVSLDGAEASSRSPDRRRHADDRGTKLWLVNLSAEPETKLEGQLELGAYGVARLRLAR